MKFQFNGKKFATLAELVTYMSTCTYAQLTHATKGLKDGYLAAYKQAHTEREAAIAQEMVDNGGDAAAAATAVDAIDFDNIIGNGDDFLITPITVVNTPPPPANTARRKFAKTAEAAAAMVKANVLTDLDVRLVGARFTNQTASTGAKQIVLTFRRKDGSEFTGFTYASFMLQLKTSDAFKQFEISSAGLPILTDGESALEPIVGIKVLPQIAEKTGYESADIEHVKAAKEEGAYTIVSNRGRNAGKEVCYIAHETNNDGVFRTFRDGVPNRLAFETAEKLHGKRTEAVEGAKVDAEVTSTISRSAADDKAYETETVTRATVKVQSEELKHRLAALKAAFDEQLLTEQEYTAAKSKLLGLA